MHCPLRQPVWLLMLLTGRLALASDGAAAARYALQEWAWGPALPYITAGSACTASSDAVISIGGAYWDGLESGTPKKLWRDDVVRLAPQGTHWEQGPTFPSAVSHALAVVVGDELVVIGGRNAEQAFDTVWRLSLTDAMPEWRAGSTLPRAEFGLGGGVAGSVIYVVTDSHATISGTRDLDHPPQVLAWNTTAPVAAWEVVAEPPSPDVGFRTIAIVGNRLVLMGGGVARGDAMHLVDTLYVLDLDTRQWSRGASLKTPLRDATAAALDDRRILLVGGVEEAGPQTQGATAPAIILSNRCWIYDIQTDEFTPVKSLPLAVADHGLAIANRQIFVVAGEDSPYRTRTAQVQVAALCAAAEEVTKVGTTARANGR